MLKFHHGPAIGDVIYSLPLMQHLGGGYLYLDPLSPSTRYYDKFLLAKSFFDRQQCVYETIVLLDNEGVFDEQFVDLNSFRYHFSHKKDNLVRSHFAGLGIKPPRKIDPWLKAKKMDAFYPIVLHRTMRYNSLVDYSFLKKIPKKMLYCIGYSEEREIWQNYLDAGEIETKTLDDMASVINSCGILIGNQSSPLALAVGLGKPRMVERGIQYDNCRFGSPWEMTLTDNAEDNYQQFKWLCKEIGM